MAKHGKMSGVNRQESERKIEMALQETKSASDEGKRVSVSELSRKTRLSKGFFYKNELYKRELEKLKKENEELKKGNQKLTKILDKARLAYLELL